jgi:aspartyl-tRNA(Asn)/glutamyl-tRNA(Gln) amidotransferase subunit A
MSSSAKYSSSELSLLDLSEASRAVQKKEVSPVDLTQACLARIERFNPKLNAFITVTDTAALEEARKAEDEIARGEWKGPLHGIPLAVKDLIETAGVKTTAASAVLKDHIPTADAEVIRRLRSAGATCTNLRTEAAESSATSARRVIRGIPRMLPADRLLGLQLP